jgi:transcriptional regulator with XRE-family HTH domain
VPTKTAKPPTVRLRRLAIELRRLRAETGLSREQVESSTGINAGTLYRIETARARPQRRTLIGLLNLYGVGEPSRSELLEIARSADGQGWLRPYHSELPEEYAAYIAFEAEAREVRNYESLFVPGLLQTEPYARAVIAGTLPMASAPQVEQRVLARMERQALLQAELELWAIVDEAALRRMVGDPGIMRGQLNRLLDAMDMSNVTLQVITFDAGAHPGMSGSFVHMDFKDPEGPELVYVDTLAGDLFLEAEPDLRRYSAIFDHLRAVALSPAQTQAMIAHTIKGLEGG